MFPELSLVPTDEYFGAESAVSTTLTVKTGLADVSQGNPDTEVTFAEVQ